MKRHLLNDPFLKNLSEKELHEIETRVENWGLNNPSFEETVSRWFGNFTASDKHLALKVFSNIDYFNPSRFSERLKELFSSVKRYIFEKGISESSIVIGVPKGQGDSAHRHAYDSHKIWGLSLNQVLAIEELYQKDLTSSVLVLFNDTHGTGNQFIRDVWEKVKKLPKPPQETIVLAINIAKQALERFHENLPDVLVIPDISARSAESIFTASEYERLTEIGRKVYSKYPLGYGNISLLTAYYFQCPNNTLPIIWADGKNNSVNDQDGYPWYPLFPYIPKKSASKNLFSQTFQIEIKEHQPSSQSSQLVHSNPANKNLFDKYFKYKKHISEVTPKDILDYRFSSFREFYYQRNIDEEVFQNFQEEKNILIIGNSLSGKTRAVYELITKLNEIETDAEIYFPKESLPKLVSLDDLRSNLKKFVFFDDIDDYYKSKDTKSKTIDKFILELIKTGFQIIATCRTGPEYKEFSSNSSYKVREILSKIIKIEKVNPTVIREIAEKEYISLEESEFDGNIGSIILPIQKMRDRYNYLRENPTEINKLSINFLKSLKAFYISSNFYTKSKYDLAKVEDYCIRLTVGQHASSNLTNSNLIKQQFLKVKKKMDFDLIESFLKNKGGALENLQSDDISLNFINIEENRKFIRIEEVYLEKIVKYHPIKILKDINNLFEPYEKSNLGFFVKTDSLNRLISQSDSYQEAKDLYGLMKHQGVIPNADTFSYLINKSENYDTSERWYKQSLSSQKINTSIFGEIIKKSPNQSLALSYIEEFFSYSQNHLEVSDKAISWIIDCYLKLKFDSLDFNKIFSLFEQYSVPFNVSILHNFLSKTQSQEQAFVIIDKAVKDGLALDITTYNILLGKTQSQEQVSEILDKAAKDGLTLDIATYNILLGKTQSQEQAFEILDKAVRDGLTLDITSYNILLMKAQSQEQVFVTLDKAVKDGIALDIFTYNILISKTQSLEVSYKILDKAVKDGFTLDARIYNTLIMKAQSQEQVFEILDKAVKDGFTLDAAFSYKVLIAKAQSQEQAFEIFDKAVKDGITLDDGFYHTLIMKAQSQEQAFEILDKAVKDGFTLDITTYKILLGKTQSQEQAFVILDKAVKDGITLDDDFSNKILIARAQSQEENNEILDKAVKADVRHGSFIDINFIESLESIIKT